MVNRRELTELDAEGPSMRSASCAVSNDGRYLGVGRVVQPDSQATSSSASRNCVLLIPEVGVSDTT